MKMWIYNPLQTCHKPLQFATCTMLLSGTVYNYFRLRSKLLNKYCCTKTNKLLVVYGIFFLTCNFFLLISLVAVMWNWQTNFLYIEPLHIMFYHTTWSLSQTKKWSSQTNYNVSYFRKEVWKNSGFNGIWTHAFQRLDTITSWDTETQVRNQGNFKGFFFLVKEFLCDVSESKKSIIF